MIELYGSDFFSFCLFLCLGLLAFLWFRELRRQRIYDWDLTQERPCTCHACQYTFMMKNNETIARCPRCNAICTLRKMR